MAGFIMKLLTGATGISFILVIASIIGWYVIPPQSFSDRLHVISSSDVAINLSIYNNPKYADSWWDTDGWAHILHKMNPLRADYFDSVISKTFKNPKRQDGVVENPFLIEIGCGGGLLTLELAKRGYNITGMDVSKESLHAAKKQAEKLGLDVKFKSGDIYDIPAVDATFDVVIITEVTEKLLNLQLAYKEIARVLKPGGIVVFDTINRTFKSWIIVANLLESPFVNAAFPKYSHDWRLFVKPDELESLLAEHRLSGQEFVGLYPLIQLPSLADVTNANLVTNIIGFEQTEALDLMYMGYAIKEAHVKE